MEHYTIHRRDNGSPGYWKNLEHLTGLQAESIKRLIPYRAAVSLMPLGEHITFNLYAQKAERYELAFKPNDRRKEAGQP
ncbi:hypothetical protein QOT17_020153 [Balamuthia mandrillaris]